MSTLQLTLIALGVVFIIGLIIYNQWYYIRYAPRKARPGAEQQPAAQRREPGLAGGGSSPPAGGLFGLGKSHGHELNPDPQGLAIGQDALEIAEDPQNADTAVPGELPASPLAGETAAAALPGSHYLYGNGQEFDSLVFSVVPLALDKPVSGDTALAALPPTRRVGKKQFLIQGLNMQTQEWEMPQAGALYSAFEAAIQLANRQGPLNELEFSEFVLKTQAFADDIGAAPDFPDMLHEVARGREVDQFAVQNDAVLNLMLVTRRATWSTGYVRQCAARHGFKPSVTPGRLVLNAVNPAAPPVLVLSYDPQAALADDLDHAPLTEILFTLDVPNVERSEHAFPRLQEILEEMAQTMDGTVTDPDGRKLPAMAMESISADIERLYDALETRGFPAGSPSALKLFS